MSSTLTRLTSLSTQTLTLILERQRLQSLSASSGASISLPSSSLAQITRNLEQLRTGIHDLEEQRRSKNTNIDAEATSLLREQYERMRDMLGADKEKTEPLLPPPSRDEVKDEDEQAGQELNTITTPYKDYPDTEQQYPNGTDSRPFDSAEVLESQRLMMEEQDTHLNSLHTSLTRQHTLSQELSSELDVHVGLLTELDTEITNTTSRLGRARKTLDRIGRGCGSNGSTVTIAVLILILLILIIVFKT